MNQKPAELQQQAASTVDLLLHITEDVGKYVITPYGTGDGAFVEIQCQIFLKRCQSLEEQLLRLQDALTPFETSTPLSQNETDSLGITRQILIQNLQLVKEKQILLQDLLSHSQKCDILSQESRLLQEQAKLVEFQRVLNTM